MQIRNKARFWTGAIMGLFELIGLGIFGLTLLDWSWLTFAKIVAAEISLAVILYNALAAILIWTGSEPENRK